MKNIFLIPAIQASRLAYIGSNGLCLGESFPNTRYCRPQNIYITSDKAVTSRCYFLLEGQNEAGVYEVFWNDGEKGLIDGNCKEIIMTTDPKLLDTGVQTVPEHFLQWFVLNPSSERVELRKDVPEDNWRYSFLPYKIELAHIPQVKLNTEKPDSETIRKRVMDLLKEKWNHLYISGYPTEPFPSNYENEFNKIVLGIYQGIERQKKESYTEEEAGELVYNIIGEYAKLKDITIDGEVLNDLFNKLKK